MAERKEDLTRPLLEGHSPSSFYGRKKEVAKRAHDEGESSQGNNENEAPPRIRGRSLSMCTDPDEFNIARKMDPTEYYYLHLWGEDLEEEESLDMALTDVNKTWTVEELLQLKNAPDEEKKKLRNLLMRTHVKKLNNVMVFFTLLKGFIGAGILFLPNGFHNGGWVFAVCSLVFSMLITLSALLLLIKVSEKYEGLSFSDLGLKALGLPGKYVCDLTLATSQAGFCTAATVFTYQNLDKIIYSWFGYHTAHWKIGVLCFLIYTPLTWVRRLHNFAKFHLFADIAVLSTVAIIACYSAVYLMEEKEFSRDVQPFNHDSYLVFVGTAIYAFEGVGIVLPVRDTCERPQDYPKILTLVLLFVLAIYTSFGAFNYFVYGSHMLSEAPLVTKLMPSNSLPIEIAMLLFITNIFISYPLVIHPTNIVVESYIYRSMAQSLFRKWLKNINRTFIVMMTVVVALWLESSIDRLMSVIGSLACTPIAFVMPCVLHLFLVADTFVKKAFDMFLISIGMFLMIFITGYTFRNWN